jgi:hypothetical protein
MAINLHLYEDETMKTKLILIATMFAALVSFAQTNGIIFPQLLSSTNTVLMTNAEFRSYSGSRIIFKNDEGYQSFRAPDLNTNVLNALHITAAQLDLKQQALDAARQKYKDQAYKDQVAYEAERERQLAIEQRAEAEKKQSQRQAHVSPPGTVNYYQQVGAY